MPGDKKSAHKEPVAAAGNYDWLEERATREEKKAGNFTRVTRLSLDEADPS